MSMSPCEVNDLNSNRSVANVIPTFEVYTVHHFRWLMYINKLPFPTGNYWLQLPWVNNKWTPWPSLSLLFGSGVGELFITSYQMWFVMEPILLKIDWLISKHAQILTLIFFLWNMITHLYFAVFCRSIHFKTKNASFISLRRMRLKMVMMLPCRIDVLVDKWMFSIKLTC